MNYLIEIYQLLVIRFFRKRWAGLFHQPMMHKKSMDNINSQVA